VTAELVEEPVVAPAQERRQLERPDLLRRIAPDEQPEQVRALALVRGHPVHEAVEVAAVPGRDEPERDVAEEDERKQQRLDRRERDDDADHHDARARDPEQAVDRLERSPRALCLRPPQPVVEVRRLEREQVDLRRDVDYPVERAARDELAEHAAVLRLDGAGEVARDGDRDEGDELRDDVLEGAAGAGREHGVQDGLADEELRRDPERRDELEHGREQELRAAGLPDEPERVGEQPRQVAPRAARALGVHDVDPRARVAARLVGAVVRVAVGSAVECDDVCHALGQTAGITSS
jgi:hypothetical protein